MQKLAPFVNAVESIYTAASDPSHWPTALQAIANCLDDVGAILIYGKDDGSFGVIESASLTAICQEYKNGWSHRDVRAVRTRQRGYFFKRDVITDRDLLSPEEMKSDPFYTELLSKHGLKYFAAAMVSPDPRVEVGLSIQRSNTKSEFSEAELNLLERIGPHVERSLRLGIRLMDAELSKVGLGMALARIGIGVFVLDSVGRVLFSNPAANSLIGDGLDIVDDYLFLKQRNSDSAITPVKKCVEIEDIENITATVRPILIHRRKSERPLTFYLLPIPVLKSTMSSFLTNARAIALVLDPDSGESFEPSLIRDVLGLTLGEARLASLVGSGLRPREAAGKLGITEETARTVLKRVFSKVGVSRQTELAALMTKLILK